jgi:hypothetical protein
VFHRGLLSVLFVLSPVVLLHAAQCDLSGYKRTPGLHASVEKDGVTIQWDGKHGDEIRMRLALRSGTPVVAEISIRGVKQEWRTLGTELKPEFRVETGIRRLPNEQIAPLKAAGIALTPQVVDENKWEAFWDAPLRVSGQAAGPYARNIRFWMPPAEGIGDLPGLPRREAEIRRSSATYHSDGCSVRTNGARLEVEFPGAVAGPFQGRLQYTVYRGSNLIRQEIVARTEEKSVAYRYEGGLSGFPISPASRVAWRDIANNWQQNRFGGPINDDEFSLLAANRVIAAQLGGGTVATFPPPHTFFWARELSVNLGYNWFRKDSDSKFSIGVRQAESEADPSYAARGPGDYRENFSLLSARPGTWQRMPVYFFVSRGNAEDAINSVLTFTRGDRFKALPGYLVMVAHFHPYLVLQLGAFGRGISTTLPDVDALKAAGVNVYAPSDGGIYAWGDVAGQEPAIGPQQASARDAAAHHVENLRLYYEIARLHSDKDFWLLPAEEITSGTLAKQLGGHHDLLVSHPVYWGQGRDEGQTLVETDPKYGKVYHIGSPADLMEMARREDLLVFEPHPRSKASAGYPDAIKDTAYFRDERYRGFGFRWGMGLDGSERRLCDYRCLPVLDEMNNAIADLSGPPKYLEAISELHMEGPGDDVYANNPVTYVKVQQAPALDNWAPIIDGMRRGDDFVSSGEVLIPSYNVDGVGDQRTIVADVQWTFPLEFVEVVWGDGQRIDHQIISATDLPPFGRHIFRIPFNAAGKKWVRFAAWDSAGDGALAQPVKLQGPPPAGAMNTSAH